MDFYVAAVCFPVVFLGELPDKTMFANLVMAARGHPLLVWLGASAAFAVHTGIAVTVGVALFALVPHHVVDLVVGVLFVAGALYAWAGREEQTEALAQKEVSRHSIVVGAFVVIFLAEWGDLTQVLTADLAARYRSPLSVGTGALAALLVVGALAVGAGRALARYVRARFIRRVTAVVLAVLAASSFCSAAH